MSGASTKFTEVKGPDKTQATAPSTENAKLPVSDPAALSALRKEMHLQAREQKQRQDTNNKDKKQDVKQHHTTLEVREQLNKILAEAQVNRNSAPAAPVSAKTTGLTSPGTSRQRDTDQVINQALESSVTKKRKRSLGHESLPDSVRSLLDLVADVNPALALQAADKIVLAQKSQGTGLQAGHQAANQLMEVFRALPRSDVVAVLKLLLATDPNKVLQDTLSAVQRFVAEEGLEQILGSENPEEADDEDEEDRNLESESRGAQARPVQIVDPEGYADAFSRARTSSLTAAGLDESTATALVDLAAAFRADLATAEGDLSDEERKKIAEKFAEQILKTVPSIKVPKESIVAIFDRDITFILQQREAPGKLSLAGSLTVDQRLTDLGLGRGAASPQRASSPAAHERFDRPQLLNFLPTALVLEGWGYSEKAQNDLPKLLETITSAGIPEGTTPQKLADDWASAIADGLSDAELGKISGRQIPNSLSDVDRVRARKEAVDRIAAYLSPFLADADQTKSPDELKDGRYEFKLIDKARLQGEFARLFAGTQPLEHLAQEALTNKAVDCRQLAAILVGSISEKEITRLTGVVIPPSEHSDRRKAAFEEAISRVEQYLQPAFDDLRAAEDEPPSADATANRNVAQREMIVRVTRLAYGELPQDREARIDQGFRVEAQQGDEAKLRVQNLKSAERSAEIAATRRKRELSPEGEKLVDRLAWNLPLDRALEVGKVVERVVEKECTTFDLPKVPDNVDPTTKFRAERARRTRVTERAGEIAGLIVKDLVKEPGAAWSLGQSQRVADDLAKSIAVQLALIEVNSPGSDSTLKIDKSDRQKILGLVFGTGDFPGAQKAKVKSEDQIAASSSSKQQAMPSIVPAAEVVPKRVEQLGRDRSQAVAGISAWLASIDLAKERDQAIKDLEADKAKPESARTISKRFADPEKLVASRLSLEYCGRLVDAIGITAAAQLFTGKDPGTRDRARLWVADTVQRELRSDIYFKLEQVLEKHNKKDTKFSKSDLAILEPFDFIPDRQLRVRPAAIVVSNQPATNAAEPPKEYRFSFKPDRPAQTTAEFLKGLRSESTPGLTNAGIEKIRSLVEQTCDIPISEFAPATGKKDAVSPRLSRDIASAMVAALGRDVAQQRLGFSSSQTVSDEELLDRAVVYLQPAIDAAVRDAQASPRSQTQLGFQPALEAAFRRIACETVLSEDGRPTINLADRMRARSPQSSSTVSELVASGLDREKANKLTVLKEVLEELGAESLDEATAVQAAKIILENVDHAFLRQNVLKRASTGNAANDEKEIVVALTALLREKPFNTKAGDTSGLLNQIVAAGKSATETPVPGKLTPQQIETDDRYLNGHLRIVLPTVISGLREDPTRAVILIGQLRDSLSDEDWKRVLDKYAAANNGRPLLATLQLAIGPKQGLSREAIDLFPKEEQTRAAEYLATQYALREATIEDRIDRKKEELKAFERQLLLKLGPDTKSVPTEAEFFKKSGEGLAKIDPSLADQIGKCATADDLIGVAGDEVRKLQDLIYTSKGNAAATKKLEALFSFIHETKTTSDTLQQLAACRAALAGDPPKGSDPNTGMARMALEIRSLESLLKTMRQDFYAANGTLLGVTGMLDQIAFYGARDQKPHPDFPASNAEYGDHSPQDIQRNAREELKALRDRSQSSGLPEAQAAYAWVQWEVTTLEVEALVRDGRFAEAQARCRAAREGCPDPKLAAVIAEAEAGLAELGVLYADAENLVGVADAMAAVGPATQKNQKAISTRVANAKPEGDTVDAYRARRRTSDGLYERALKFSEYRDETNLKAVRAEICGFAGQFVKRGRDTNSFNYSQEQYSALSSKVDGHRSAICSSLTRALYSFCYFTGPNGVTVLPNRDISQDLIDEFQRLGFSADHVVSNRAALNGVPEGAYTAGLSEYKALWARASQPLNSPARPKADDPFLAARPVVSAPTRNGSSTPLRDEGIKDVIELWLSEGKTLGGNVTGQKRPSIEKIAARDPGAAAKVLAAFASSPDTSDAQRRSAEALIVRLPGGGVVMRPSAEGFKKFEASLSGDPQNYAPVMMALVAAVEAPQLEAWAMRPGSPKGAAEALAAIARFDKAALRNLDKGLQTELTEALNGPQIRIAKVFPGAKSGADVARIIDGGLTQQSAKLPEIQVVRAILIAAGRPEEAKKLDRLSGPADPMYPGVLSTILASLDAQAAAEEQKLLAIAVIGPDGKLTIPADKEEAFLKQQDSLRQLIGAQRAVRLIAALESLPPAAVSAYESQLQATPEGEAGKRILQILQAARNPKTTSAGGDQMAEVIKLLAEHPAALASFTEASASIGSGEQLEAMFAQLAPADAALVHDLYKRATGISLDDRIIERFQSGYFAAVTSKDSAAATALAQALVRSKALSPEAKERLFPGVCSGQGDVNTARLNDLVKRDLSEAAQTALGETCKEGQKAFADLARDTAGARALVPLVTMAADSEALKEVQPRTHLRARLFAQGNLAQVATLEKKLDGASPGLSQRLGFREVLHAVVSADSQNVYDEMTSPSAKSAKILPVLTRLTEENRKELDAIRVAEQEVVAAKAKVTQLSGKSGVRDWEKPAADQELADAKAWLARSEKTLEDRRSRSAPEKRLLAIEAAIRHANLDPNEGARVRYLYGLEQGGARTVGVAPGDRLGLDCRDPFRLKTALEPAKGGQAYLDSNRYLGAMHAGTPAADAAAVAYFSRLPPEALKSAVGSSPIPSTLPGLQALKDAFDKKDVAAVHALALWAEANGGGYRTLQEITRDVLSLGSDPAKSAELLASTVKKYQELAPKLGKSNGNLAEDLFGSGSGLVSRSAPPEAYAAERKLWDAIASNDRSAIVREILAVAMRADDPTVPVAGTQTPGAAGVDYELAAKAQNFGTPAEIERALQDLAPRIEKTLAATWYLRPQDEGDVKVPAFFSLLHLRSLHLPEKDRASAATADIMFVIALATSERKVSPDVLAQLQMQRQVFDHYSKTLQRLHDETTDLRNQALGASAEYRSTGDKKSKEAADCVLNLADGRNVFQQRAKANYDAHASMKGHAEYLQADGVNRVDRTRQAVGAAHMATVYFTLRDTEDARMRRDDLLAATARSVAELDRYIRNDLRRKPADWDKIQAELDRTAKLEQAYNEKIGVIYAIRDVAITVGCSFIPYVGTFIGLAIVAGLHIYEHMRANGGTMWDAIYAKRYELLVMVVTTFVFWGAGKILSKLFQPGVVHQAAAVAATRQGGKIVVEQTTKGLPKTFIPAGASAQQAARLEADLLQRAGAKLAEKGLDQFVGTTTKAVGSRTLEQLGNGLMTAAGPLGALAYHLVNPKAQVNPGTPTPAPQALATPPPVVSPAAAPVPPAGDANQVNQLLQALRLIVLPPNVNIPPELLLDIPGLVALRATVEDILLQLQILIWAYPQLQAVYDWLRAHSGTPEKDTQTKEEKKVEVKTDGDKKEGEKPISDKDKKEDPKAAEAATAAKPAEKIDKASEEPKAVARQDDWFYQNYSTASGDAIAKALGSYFGGMFGKDSSSRFQPPANPPSVPPGGGSNLPPPKPDPSTGRGPPPPLSPMAPIARGDSQGDRSGNAYTRAIVLELKLNQPSGSLQLSQTTVNLGVLNGQLTAFPLVEGNQNSQAAVNSLQSSNSLSSANATGESNKISQWMTQGVSLQNASSQDLRNGQSQGNSLAAGSVNASSQDVRNSNTSANQSPLAQQSSTIGVSQQLSREVSLVSSQSASTTIDRLLNGSQTIPGGETRTTSGVFSASAASSRTAPIASVIQESPTADPTNSTNNGWGSSRSRSEETITQTAALRSRGADSEQDRVVAAREEKARRETFELTIEELHRRATANATNDARARLKIEAGTGVATNSEPSARDRSVERASPTSRQRSRIPAEPTPSDQTAASTSMNLTAESGLTSSKDQAASTAPTPILSSRDDENLDRLMGLDPEKTDHLDSARRRAREKRRLLQKRQARMRAMVIQQLLTQQLPDAMRAKMLGLLLELGISESEYRQISAQVGKQSADRVITEVATERVPQALENRIEVTPLRENRDSPANGTSNGTPTATRKVTPGRSKAEVYRRLREQRQSAQQDQKRSPVRESREEK